MLWRYLRGSQADFYRSTVKLFIERDGESHYDDLGIAHDQARDAYMHANAMKILRFTNNDVTERLEGVIETIRETLRAANA